MTALTSSTELLHKMTKSNEKVSLPKRILVKDEESGTTAYFPEKFLKPSRKFDYNETEDSYIVTNVIDSIAVKEETDIDDASSEDSSENSDDLDDITYEFPKQYSHDMADEFELEPSAPSHATEIVGSPVLAETICSSVEANDSDLNGGALGNQSYCVNEESDINDNRISNNIDINDNTFLDPDLLNLLPENFDRGYDGMGASFMEQKKKASYFREPWKLSDADIQIYLRMTKNQFFKLALTCTGAKSKSSELNIFAECFLMCLKLSHQISFRFLASLFCLNSPQLASSIFYRQLVHQYKFNCNIPCIVSDNQVNQAEVDKLLHTSYCRTPDCFKYLLEDFEDPAGINQKPVALNIDGTYIDIEGSEDLELQKYMYYGPRANHVAKFINMTDLSPKFIALIPIASSQTPSSGDGLLLANYIEIDDGSPTGHYVRSILRGNETYFVILICDTGFVMKAECS